MSTQAEAKATSQSEVSAADPATGSEPGAGQKQPTKEGDAPTEETRSDALGGEPAKAPKEGDAPTEGDAKGGAPESYEFTPPAGQEHFVEVLQEDFGKAARALNLTQEGAQSLLDVVLPKLGEVAQTRLAQARTEWHEAAKKDPTIGGESFETNLAIANKAFNSFGDDELRSILETSGLGNHPAMLRLFHKIGSQISEDSLVTGGRPARGQEDLSDPSVRESRMYPKK